MIPLNRRASLPGLVDLDAPFSVITVALDILVTSDMHS